MSSDEQQKLNEIFFPYSVEKENECFIKHKQLAYYTDAETAVKIIKNSELWLRNISVMNDYAEVKLGFNYVNDLLSSSIGNEFIKGLSQCTKIRDITHWQTIIDNFKNIGLQSFQHNTYILCFTEHLPEEKNIGRLSMWRTYGQNNGVAFVFKSLDSIKRPICEALNLLLSPIIYLHDNLLEEIFQKTIKNIHNNKELLFEVGTKEIQDYIMYVLFNIAITIKHTGFKEEKEWRIIISDKFHSIKNMGNPTKTSFSHIETIRGITQQILKLKWGNGRNLLTDELGQIIISPTQDENISIIKRQAFIKLLNEHLNIDIHQCESMVKVSEIPFRNI